MKKQTLIALSIVVVAMASVFAIKNPDHGTNLPKATANPYFLFISDIHLNRSSKTTNIGCDTGTDLWESFLKKVDSICHDKINPPAFVICTGDMPAHPSCSNSCQHDCSCTSQNNETDHNANDSLVLNGLRSTVNNTGIPLLFLPGNNDALNNGFSDADYYSFTDANGNTPFILSPDSANPYPALNSTLINGDIGLGYYSVSPIKGLRVISLNTVIYDHKFQPSGNQASYGNQQMTFLSNELAAALKDTQKVYIAMHIPPGIDAYKNSPMWTDDNNNWLNTFLATINKYKSTVAGILYGHTHMDELRRIYDSTGNMITEVAISCPGVTPDHCNYPGFKTIEFDPASKELMNFTTYYTSDLNNSSWGDKKYDFNTTYKKSPGTTICNFLKNPKMSDAAIAAKMKLIYKVTNGTGNASIIQKGIPVKWKK